MSLPGLSPLQMGQFIALGARTFYSCGEITARDFPLSCEVQLETTVGGPETVAHLPALPGGVRVGSSSAAQGILFTFSLLGGPGNSASFPVKK